MSRARAITLTGSPTTLPADVVQLARRQGGAVTAAQLNKWLSHPGTSRAVRDGALVRLWRGAYALGDCAQQPRTRLAAADLTLGQHATACLDTAAALYGFDIGGDPRTYVLAPGTSHSRHENLVLHRRPRPPSLVVIGGRTAVHPAETAVAVAARASSPQRTLAILDAALASRAVRSVDELAVAAAGTSANGICAVRSLITLADGRAESPPESWLRWLCHNAGLPAPVPQYSVRGADGRWYRLDLAWPDLRVGCEYDGVEFHTGAALQRDRMRLNALSSAGWVIVSATGSMVWSGAAAFTTQLRDVLRARPVSAQRTSTQ